MPPDLVRQFDTPDGSIRIVLVDPGRSPSPRTMDHLQFITGHSAELTAAAFEGFLRHGAGAVVLWRDTAPRRFWRRPFEPHRLWYATQLHTLPGASEGAFSGWEAAQVERYDPQREGVVLFVEGGRFAAYRVSGPMLPRDALQATRAQMN